MMSAPDSGWADFLTLCLDSEQPEALDAVLRFFLTSEERHQIGLRVELIRALIKADKTQRDIAKSLEVSIATITRGSNMLKDISPDLLAFLKEQLLDE